MNSMQKDITLEEANKLLIFIQSYGWLNDENGIKTPLQVAEKRLGKLKNIHCRSSLCADDYKEMMMLDKAISLGIS